MLFKNHPKSRKFRRVWLNSARLEHIVNFAHVRQIFFSNPQREAQSVSPFLSVVFQKTLATPSADNSFEYWSAKRTATIENTSSVILNRGDMHWLSQRDCLAYEKLWKIYWWGSHRDEVLIRQLERFPKFSDLSKHFSAMQVLPNRGFQEGNKANKAEWLKEYQELPPEALRRYGPFDSGLLRDVPATVERRGVEDVYRGHRLLVGRGIKAGGLITARLETRKYAFRNSIHGVRLKGLEPWQEATIIAIFWSSLARYFYFTTSGSWGFWHDEIHLGDVEQMPICFPKDGELRDRIVRVVSELRRLDMPPANMELFQGTAADDLSRLEAELNKAVFELYGLTDAERDLIREKCSIGLDLFYQHHRGKALHEVVQPPRDFGTLSDLPQSNEELSAPLRAFLLPDTDEGLSAYLRTFLEAWNAELAPDGEFIWRVLSPPSHAPLLAVSFTTRYRNDQRLDESGEHDAWPGVLADLQRHSVIPAGTSRIFIDNFFRHVGDHQILFIKRNERRFWTRTAAREDAESALTHLMNLEDGVPGDREGATRAPGSGRSELGPSVRLCASRFLSADCYC